MEIDPEENGSVDRLLRRKEAAQYVAATYGFPCSPNTLAKLACVSSDGPPFRMAGRIPLYPQDGLDSVGSQQDRTFGPLDLRTRASRCLTLPKRKPGSTIHILADQIVRTGLSGVFNVHKYTPHPLICHPLSGLPLFDWHPSSA